MLLEGMGIKFADEYHCLDRDGDVIGSGKFCAEPHFVAATSLSKDYRSQAAFKRLGSMSSDVHAVNQALHAGSNPENLTTAPLIQFLEASTNAGMIKAREFLNELLRAKADTTRSSGQPTSHSPRRPRAWASAPGFKSCFAAAPAAERVHIRPRTKDAGPQPFSSVSSSSTRSNKPLQLTAPSVALRAPSGRCS